MSSKSEIENLRKEFLRIKNPTAENVVAYARANPKSVLHSKFTWDNGEGGELWRLHQARIIIRTIKVEIVPFKGADKVITPNFISLVSDRKPGGGVYTPVGVVLADEEKKESFLLQTLKTLDAVQGVWLLDELKEVAAAITKAKAKWFWSL